MRDRLILRAFLLAWEWLPKIPESIAKPLAAFVADLAWIGNGKGVRQLQTNLARVTGLQFDERVDRACAGGGGDHGSCHRGALFEAGIHSRHAQL